MRGAVAAGLLGVTLGVFAGGPAPQQSKKPALSKVEAAKRLAVSEASFTENVGQWNSRGKFLSRTRNVDLWVTPTGAVYDYHTQVGTKGGRKGQVIEMSFVGGKTASVAGNGLQPGKTDFFKGGSKKVKTAHRYGSVLQKGVYHGVDAKYYVDGDKPRYDLILAPNADPNQIKLRFGGADSTSIKDGEVDLKTQLGSLLNGRPVAFQWISGKKSPVSAKYAMTSKGEVRFSLGAYDRSKSLIIDPLVYGSYYGGESGNDEVRNVVSDLDGGVYLVGATMAPDFPALQGPYTFNSIGGFDCFVAKLQGDAYSNIYAAYFGGSNDEFSQFCSLDPLGNLWIAGRTWSTDFPSNPRDNIQFLHGDPSATGGTFRIWYGNTNNRTGNLPFNATTTQVFNALNNLQGIGNQVISVTSVNGGQLPNATYRIVSNGDLAPLFIGAQSEGAALFGLAPRFEVDNSNATFARITNNRSIPTGGIWTITFTNGTNVATTAGIQFNASAGAVQLALNALTNLNGGTFSVGGGPLSNPQRAPYVISFTPQNGAPTRPNITVNSANLFPHPVFVAEKNPDIFVMRWQKDSIKVLDPLPDRVQIFGGDGEERLAGFAVKQNDTPNLTDPILLGWSGDAGLALNEIAGPQTSASYVARYSFDGTNFTENTLATKYMEGTMPTNMGGFAMDRAGNSYVAGSVGDGSNDDNPTGSGAFPTTNGIFIDGGKLRAIDVYVRKYDLTGKMLLSGLVGGNGNDTIGGIDFDPTGQTVNTGSCVAVDPQNNIYITGIARSFNFPRTRGVIGESFNASANIFVTKVSADGTTFSYSTNLGTSGLVIPAGIGVDPSGNAFISGNAHPNFVDFPETTGQQPGDPEQPTTEAFPSVPLVGALDPTYDSTKSPDFPTMEGFLQVIDSTATTRIYGSWAGGFLDDMVFGPYVDRFGDVWINGWTDSFRGYVRVSSTGTPTIFQDNGSLPAALISPLAFKSTPAAGGGTGMTLVYGGYGDRFGQTFAPSTISATYQRDGWLAKLRLGLTPSIQSVTMNPNTAPGGFGASSAGTVTLSSAAPTGGAIVEFSIDNGNAASFDANAPSTTTTISIAAGATTGTFTVFTKPVTTNTAVQIKATYLGSFQIAQLNVVPWLQSVGVTPNALVGGNLTNGRITLSAPAPAGGVTISLSADKPALLGFPAGATVTVPAGQSSAVFSIQTHGVAKKSFATVTGSLGGVNRSSAITLSTANLLNLTFAPPVIPGLGTTTGTIKLDGEAGSTFTVAISGLGSNFTFPSTVTFTAGDSSKSFDVVTPYVGAQTNKVVTATRAASGGTDGYLAGTVTGSFTISFVALKSLSVAPSPIEGGDTAVGTVELANPAPTGGVIVKLASSPTGIVTMPATVTVPEGSATASFNIGTPISQTDKTVTIKAFRISTEPVTATLVIKSATFVLTLDQTSVVGGQANVTGTVTLSKAAGSGGLKVNLTSSNTAAATVPTSVFIPSGSLSASFTVTTKSVTVTSNTTITGTLGSNTSSADLEVRAVGVASVIFDNASVRGGSAAPVTITLDAPAPAAGLTITLSVSNNLFSNLPSTVKVAAGATSVRLTSLLTKRVSRDQVVSLTASTPSSQASGTLKVTQAF